MIRTIEHFFSKICICAQWRPVAIQFKGCRHVVLQNNIFPPGRAQHDPPPSGVRRAREVHCSQSLRQLGEPEAIVRIILWRRISPASSLSDPPSSDPDWLPPYRRIQTGLQWWRCSYVASRFVTFDQHHTSLPCCFMLVRTSAQLRTRVSRVFCINVKTISCYDPLFLLPVKSGHAHTFSDVFLQLSAWQTVLSGAMFARQLEMRSI